jgi:hypothetical protein
MSAYESLGVVVKRSFLTNSVSVSGVSVSQNESTRLEMKLPRPAPIHASFRRRSWGDALVKLFKKGIQTGEKSFDDLIYISTKTDEATRAFLGAQEIRDAIALTIETGGALEIEDDRVVARVAGHDKGDDASMVRILTALLR